MVEDYHLRKTAKKKRKREGADERGKDKRVRPKKNKVRRICRGLCYKEPFAVRSRSNPDVAVGEPTDDHAASSPPKAKRRRKAGSKVAKQSTSVNLLLPSQRQETKSDKTTVVLSESLAAFPAGMQDFMRDQGLPAIPPIQDFFFSPPPPPPPFLW